jgi:hypothetical protein
LAEHVVACFDLNVGSNPACFILAEHFVAWDKSIISQFEKS